MWVIFHERKSLFTHIDKNVFALVEDKDILTFQSSLANITGDMIYPLLEGCYDRVQNFVGTDYFVKQYVPMTQYTDKVDQEERQNTGTLKASLFRDVVQQSPYNTSR